MLIEQIIEFQLKEPGPPVRTYTSITGYFHDKTKISKENLRVDYYLLLKYSKRQYALLFLSGPNHLQNLTPKCKILNVFWTQIVSKMRIKQFNFFTWLSNVKNLVLWNGSEHVRDVIQWHQKRFFSKELQKIVKWLVRPQTQATASDLPFYDFFVPQKVPFSKIFDDVIARYLWFVPLPQSKTLATPTFETFLTFIFIGNTIG